MNIACPELSTAPKLLNTLKVNAEASLNHPKPEASILPNLKSPLTSNLWLVDVVAIPIVPSESILILSFPLVKNCSWSLSAPAEDSALT